VLPLCCCCRYRRDTQGINDKRLRAYIALQAAYGMEYLHLHFMVHFDMKCDNLLCDLRDLNKPVVKIGDLGLSKTKKGSFISGNMRGTLPW
jgi:serine/threonine protein kinase